MILTDAAPRRPAGHAPLRRPGSIRRTSTIETSWPQGQGEPMLMQGRARDLLTPADGPPRVTAEGAFEILATPRREIVTIASRPERADLQQLVGERAGGNLRAHLARVVPEDKAAGAPLYLILDDFSGASLVAGWAWSRWKPDWMTAARATGGASTAGRGGRMEGVCTGFRPGSTALNPDGTGNPTIQNACPVESLVNPDDPLGWHEFTVQTGVGMRRARRIDVWLEDDLILIDLGFQDSATAPEGGRIAIHEYLARATADPKTLELLSLSADPRVLPYKECPGAITYAQRMLGASLGDMREQVLETLPGVLGCTHLNDVLRSMAETPQMLETLRAA